MDTITIIPGADAWLAQFSGAHAAPIVEAFGCDTIPTPYSLAAPLDMVIADIARLNPDAAIYGVEPESTPAGLLVALS